METSKQNVIDFIDKLFIYSKLHLFKENTLLALFIFTKGWGERERSIHQLPPVRVLPGDGTERQAGALTGKRTCTFHIAGCYPAN